MAQVAKASLSKFECTLNMELPKTTELILDLANGPKNQSLVMIWSDFLNYAEGNHLFLLKTRHYFRFAYFH